MFRQTFRAALAGAAGALALGTAGLHGQALSAGPLELELTGRVQVQFTTTSVDGDEAGLPDGLAATAFETRRIRFGTEFDLDGWLTGALEADVAGGEARLTDGYIDAAFADAFRLRAGQFKKPFGLIELTSSTRIPTIERSIRIRGLSEVLATRDAVIAEEQYLLDAGMYVGRQVGVMAHGEAGPFGYAAGVFNGEGANQRDVLGSKAYAGRLTWSPGEAPFRLGAGVSVQPSGGADPDLPERHATVAGVDLEWGGFRRPGPHLMLEAVWGDDPLLATLDRMPTMAGGQAVAAWFAPLGGARVEGIEPVLRVSWADPDLDAPDDAGTTITPGINLYFAGRNRFMVNADVHVPAQDGLDPEYGLIAQIQIAF